jgi:exosortase
VLIPLISGYFIYLARKKIFSDIGYSFNTGIILIAFGILLYFIGITQGGGFNQNDYLSLITLSLVMLWIGGFVFLYGIYSFRQASFPLLFLVFMIPIPNLLADNIIYLLQIASAEVSYGFFKLTGVPIYREGLIFHLPGVSVEVAEQCSGIRSSIALFITSILAGHLFLKTGWKKVVLSLSIFPITIFKNGVRIVTLSLLGAYVDKSFLTDSMLHRRGGIPFFLFALLLLLPVLWLLRRSEKKKVTGSTGCNLAPMK